MDDLDLGQEVPYDPTAALTFIPAEGDEPDTEPLQLDQEKLLTELDKLMKLRETTMTAGWQLIHEESFFRIAEAHQALEHATDPRGIARLQGKIESERYYAGLRDELPRQIQELQRQLQEIQEELDGRRSGPE